MFLIVQLFNCHVSGCASLEQSYPSLDSFKSGVRIAQTQTEKKMSFLQQFRYCFMGNQKYR